MASFSLVSSMVVLLLPTCLCSGNSTCQPEDSVATSTNFTSCSTSLPPLIASGLLSPTALTTGGAPSPTSVPSLTTGGPPSTTNAPLSTSRASPNSSPLATSTPTPSISPTTAPPDNKNTDNLSIIRDWVVDHPIITGLSAAVLVLSVLLLCMCYLWLCKRRRHVVYEIVDVGDKESEPEGETVENHWATTDDVTDDETDSSNKGELEKNSTSKHCNGNATVPAERVTADLGATQDTNAESSQSVVADNGDRNTQETSFTQCELQPGVQQETDDTAAAYEEIPSLDAMTIDWPARLTDHHSLSDISDIA